MAEKASGETHFFWPRGGLAICGADVLNGGAGHLRSNGTAPTSVSATDRPVRLTPHLDPEGNMMRFRTARVSGHITAFIFDDCDPRIEAEER
jgi:hypothetical protein